VGGDIITRASAHDGKGDTGAREGREERCSVGHGERNSGEVWTEAGIEMWPLPWFSGSMAR